MDRIKTLLAAVIVTWPAAAISEEFPSGIYAATAELCAAGERGGLEAIFEEDAVILTADGFIGMEYSCEFVQILAGKRTPGFIVTALCEEPDMAHPELLAIMPRSEGELQVTSLTDEVAEQPSINSGTYVRCEGLTLP